MSQERNNSIPISDRIKRGRKELGLSVTEFAKVSGLSSPYICQLEKGQRTNPSLETKKKLADALGIPLKELLVEEAIEVQAQTDLKNRPGRNSETFRNEPKFRKYFHLLCECDIVVSVPGLFAWAGQFNATNGGPEILGKLPFRVYVGLKKKQDGNLDFERRLVFNPTFNDFEELKFQGSPASMWSEYKEDLIATLFENKLSKEQVTTFCRNHAFVMISEVPAGRGCNLTGAQSACMASVIALSLKFTSRNNLQKWSQTESEKLRNNKAFLKVARLSMKIEAMFFNTASGGARAVCPFIGNTTNPVFYVSEERDGKYQDPKGKNGKFTTSTNEFVRLPRSVGKHLELYDKIEFYFSRLEELPGINPTVHVPEVLDFALLYPGDPQQAAGVVLSLTDKKNKLADEGKWVDQKLFHHASEEQVRSYKFLRLCQNNPRLQLSCCYTDPIIANAIEVLYSFAQIVELGSAPTLLEGLYRSISANNYLGYNLGIENHVVQEITCLLSYKIRRLDYATGVGITVTGPERLSDVLFVCRFHSLRDFIGEILIDLCRFTGERLELDYVSWKDGVQKDGLKIEDPSVFKSKEKKEQNNIVTQKPE